VSTSYSDLRHLHVDRQIDEDRPRPARAHDVERLLKDARNQRRLTHGNGPFGDRLGDRLDVDRLEVLLVESRPGRLPGDAQDRDRVGGGGVETGDHVAPGRAGGADADADIAGLGARIAIGHVGRALDMASEDVADRSALA
jgi:hypothetical protein